MLQHFLCPRSVQKPILRCLLLCLLERSTHLYAHPLKWYCVSTQDECNGKCFRPLHGNSDWVSEMWELSDTKRQWGRSKYATGEGTVGGLVSPGAFALGTASGELLKNSAAFLGGNICHAGECKVLQNESSKRRNSCTHFPQLPWTPRAWGWNWMNKWRAGLADDAKTTRAPFEACPWEGRENDLPPRKSCTVHGAGHYNE